MPVNFNRPTERGLFGIPQPAAGASGGGLGGFINRVGRGAVRGAVPDANVRGGLQALGGPAAAIPRAIVGGIREGITGSGWYQNLFGGNAPTRGSSSPTSPGAPLPSWATPGAPQRPSPTGNEWSAGLPVYNQDQTYAGPPEAVSPGRAPTPSGPVGPSRNNNTIAEGEAAVDWARALSMANSGLNASGGSYDALNAMASRMQR